MMKAGANDYIRKDALARLVPAIEREIKDVMVRTERKKAEEALKTSEGFVRNILESVDEGFIVIDRNYRILSANRAFCILYGLDEEEVIGRYCYEITHKMDSACSEAGEDCPVRHTFMTGERHRVIHQHHSKDEGSKYFFEINSYPITDSSGQVVSVIETLNDITEKKRLEEQLRHAQKLEALGTLAGGVAHDFNNILTAISGYGGLIKMSMAEDDPNLPYIREILSSADRAAHLTQSLLIFSRKQPSELKPFDINKLVNGMKKMLLRIIGEDIETNIILSSHELVVMGDYGQLEQVLMNFVTNARDAMPHGGCLTIRVQQFVMNSEFVGIHGFGYPGRYALISVTDTGCGMDEKTKEKIFEPFFTTKGIGHGTGLSLTIVFGIIKQHNGYINCYSEPNRGTAFKVYLPVIDERLFEAEEEGTIPLKGGNETILVADDDEAIRNLTRVLLKKYGYTVIEAKYGAEAVNRFIENKERIGLLLFDVVMPKKSGKEAYEEIVRLQPGIKTIFMSGYSEGATYSARWEKGILPLLQKPIKPETMLLKIREILDS